MNTTTTSNPPAPTGRVATPSVLQAAARRFEELFAGLPVACFTFDNEGRIYDWNREAVAMFGYEGYEVLEEHFVERLCFPEHAAQSTDLIARVFFGEAVYGLEKAMRHKDGTPTWVLCGAFPLRDGAGSITGAICSALDITQRRALEKQTTEQMKRLAELNARLEAMAATDGLTGLFNHRTFREKLDAMLRRAMFSGEPLALVMLDVDCFKQLNDTFGHQAGDAVLRGVAEVLVANSRPGEIVARYGGEEFAVLLPRCNEAEAVVVAERFAQGLRRRDWTHRAVTASFGVAGVDASILNAADLVDRADRAMYASKHAGRDRATKWSAVPERTPRVRIEPAEWLAQIETARADVSGDANDRMVQQAILDHLQWKNRLRAFLSGAGEIDRKALVSHHHCRLGLWYDSLGVERFGGLHEFKAMNGPHEELHRLAARIVEAHEVGDRAGAMDMLSDLEACSVRIISCLEAVTKAATDKGRTAPMAEPTLPATTIAV